MPHLTPAQYRRAVTMLGIKNRHSDRDQELVECPYHSDTNPSLSLNYKKGVFNCFQCGRQGSIASLVYDRRHISIENLLGIDREFGEIMGYASSQVYEASEVIPEVSKPLTTLDIRGMTIPFIKSPEALTYLDKRSISRDIAQKMDVQYCEEITINGTAFNKRLLIPIYDEQHVLINMEGRDVTFSQKPKCLYPKNAIKPLFQFDQLDLTNPVFLFEGIIKMAVARSDAFFSNSTAALGSNFSDYQLAQLARIPYLIIVPDNDAAGRKMITFLRKTLKTKIEVYSITNFLIKDTDEIPKLSGMSIEEFRKNNGFQEEVNYDLGEMY